MTTTKSWMFSVLIAVMPLTAAACKATDTSSGRVGNPGPPLPGQVDSPSCDKVGHVRGIHGRVVGSQWADPYDDMFCLEIETKKGLDLPDGDPRASKSKLIRVSQQVFDRCIEGDQYPRCATRKTSK
jgi:hypothetical protein